MRPMQPNSTGSRLLAVLTEAPATTAEAAALTGLSSHLAGCHLHDLHRRGRVTRQPFDGRRDAKGRIRSWLWQAA